MLTGKAKELFLDYYWNNYIGKTRCITKKEETEDFFASLIDPLKQTLIIEWFDSVNVIIEIGIHQRIDDCNMWRGKINNNLYDELEYKASREEAINSSISKANEIYNTTH